MNWVDFFEQIKLESNLELNFQFQLPISSRNLIRIEQELKTQLPKELIEIYNLSDGILENNSIYLWIIWQIEELIETNIAMRKLSDENNGYMPFDHLLFFADFGNGDLLAFVTLNGKIIRNDVFLWNHEDDSRQWVAPNLQQYFQWFFEEKIKSH